MHALGHATTAPSTPVGCCLVFGGSGRSYQRHVDVLE